MADGFGEGLPTRRTLLRVAGLAAGDAMFHPLLRAVGPARVFDVTKFGAVGDGVALDTAAIQRAIDAAAAAGGRSQVLLRGGRKYVAGTLELKGDIDFHLADDAQLIVSTRREDYTAEAFITAHEARGLRISGTGSFQGRAREFMTGYDKAGEWWLPKEWRPKMFILTGCRDLEVRDITFAEAPNWGLHMLGCEDVLVDRIKVRNLLDVPNCDGIDPDHCRRVEIKDCDIVSGDDAIVVKTSRQEKDWGPSADIHVHDCVIETQDAGVKVGTETTSDVHDVLFERCKIKSSSRGLCIQLRDEGNVFHIAFRDIEFVSRLYSDPWWGRGEAISFTAIPRKAETKLGSLHDVTVERVKGVAENSVRVCGSASSRVRDVSFRHVDVTLDKTTRYAGGIYDNRPTTAGPGIVPHATAGFSIERADGVLIEDCSVSWGAHRPEYFGNAVEARESTGVKVVRFKGEGARKELGDGISVL
ncbi:Glycosyl hydrolases family 28 [Granulicella rosea]|uniref:Glycosyl hydrolases family 28 n=1 Tax=Granulicella rosea TaxID=474952 RepID=A0A239ME41_9BACT|nr:glycosyl hydrolase family 28 protein [Granulicella rosea]SNT41307.1 Glycosyl hydrolases family 28 [Granulicella rosea]